HCSKSLIRRQQATAHARVHTLGALLRVTKDEPHPSAAPRAKAADPIASHSPAQHIEQRIVEGKNGLARSGLALSPAPPNQLPLDSARFVAFRQNDVKTAQLGDALAQLDVYPAAGHVG